MRKRSRAGTSAPRARRRPVLEPLEPRCLMTVHLLEFPIPTANSNPLWITTNPNGNLYFTENAANQIALFNPASHIIQSFPIPTTASGPTAIVSGPGNNLYFTETAANQIARFNPITHVIEAFPIPTPSSGSSFITEGPDGNLYFTETTANQIGQFNPTTRIIIPFPIPTPNSGAAMIITGPDGNLWFLETAANALVQFNLSTHIFRPFPIPSADSGATFLTTGPDGKLYFTEPNNNLLARFDLGTHVFTFFSIPVPDSGASFLVTGSDGNLYFTQPGANQIAQFNPTTFTFTSLFVPTPASGATYMTLGLDGNLYFTESSANKIGEVRLVTRKATATTLAVMPNPTIVGQVVSLTATVTTTGAVNSTGRVAFAIDGIVQAKVPITLRNGRGKATFSATKLPPGNRSVTATFQGNSTLGSSISAPVTLLVNPAPGDGPVVVSLKRFGFHQEPTTLVLAFDKPLAVGPAEDVANYRITNSQGRSVAIKSVVYDAAGQTVTIMPAKLLNLRVSYILTVLGTGPSALTDTDGKLLDGAFTGMPGSDFVGVVDATSLRRRKRA
jgi:virginiamycin B lyase